MTNHDLYFNHAGTSWPKPDVVSTAVQEAMSAPPIHWAGQFEQAHQQIAGYFGVQDAKQILLTPGCTSALAVGIGDVFVATGKRLLTSHWEHHALHRPLLKLASAGVSLEYIPYCPGDSTGESESAMAFGAAIDLDWLQASLSKQDVGLVAITAACNVTGELLPYEAVIRMAHDNGAMVLIDAAQVVGWLDLDFPGLGADMVAFGGHKGLQSPWGIGGLYLSERAQMECVSAACALPSADQSETPSPPRPGYCDVGSVDQIALAGLRAAVMHLRQQDSGAQLSRARNQIERIHSLLHSKVKVQGAGPMEVERRMPTLAFSVMGVPSGQVAADFRQHGMTVGSGIQCAPLAHETLGTESTGLVRISVGLGQPDDEIDEAIDRMASMALLK
ncbi:MAG: aminotransferase class V-fold PLP-dependent enzyme [Planctomycetota bacterium]|nr:aminotransferase class V-fold PLP-dependent enzyme [Planctomycetota bacterium]